MFGIAADISLLMISWLVNAYAILGSWVNELDRWCRANGLADGATVELFILFLLWPPLPLVFMTKSRPAIDPNAGTGGR